MAIVNEIIVTGRVKRRLIDKAAKLWQKISYWTKASDVEFNDGKTAEQKVGNINGITSDFDIGRDDIAASSSLTKTIKDDLNEGIINDRIQLVIQDDDTLGWKKDGADTVIPFIKGDFIVTHIRTNPDPKKYMCYFAGAYHHTLAGVFASVVPKNYTGNLSQWSGYLGYTRIPAGADASQLPMRDYNVYLWGPLNTRDFYL